MAKIYIVGKGCSFTSGGMIFGEGEALPTGIFSDKGVLARLIAEGQVLEQEEGGDSKPSSGNKGKDSGKKGKDSGEVASGEENPVQEG